MQIPIFPGTKLSMTPGLSLLLVYVILSQSCTKSMELSKDDTNANDLAAWRKPQPPKPPEPFYFSNCSNPTVQGTFVVGVPTTATLTMTYVNSPGGSHTGFTSSTWNGVTLKAAAGTLNVGSGSIVFKASGTPVTAGVYGFTIRIGTSNPCPVNITVVNPSPSGPTVDPGPTVGSTGVINFTYKGQAVIYKTVRAADGKIWLQQNLGSSRVAINSVDQPSYGDYFQWGRWDDGHQTPNSVTITGGPTLLNPSHIAAGNPKFITGTTASTRWWGTGGLATDTWGGATATATNGKDPCKALGAGWRLPTAAEWVNISFKEDLFGTIAAWDCNLRLPAAGYRLSYGGTVFQNGDNGHYWTSNAAANSNATVFFYDDNTYDATTGASNRAEGYPCRCIKN